MPSPRRQKYAILAALILIVFTIYLITSSRSYHHRTRYLDTMRKMHIKELKINEAQSALREAEQRAKAGINERLTRSKQKHAEREREKKRLQDLKAKEAEEHLLEQRKKAGGGAGGGDSKSKASGKKPAADGDDGQDADLGSRNDGKSPAAPIHKAEPAAQKPVLEKEQAQPKKVVVDPKPADPKTSDITDLLSGADSLLDTPPPPKQPGAAAAAVVKDTPTPTPDDNYDPKADLTALLRVAPVLVFSKTTCPYSRNAKHILLENLHITPPPHIVELDQHPHGRALQDFLKDKTGRGTVPNIFVLGKSIGGSDELTQLWQAGDLVGLLQKMGGKRLTVERAA